jgi:hypothetical protein
MYNVGEYAIVVSLDEKRVTVKQLMSVCSTAGPAFVVYAAGRASARVA